MGKRKERGEKREEVPRDAARRLTGSKGEMFGALWAAEALGGGSSKVITGGHSKTALQKIWNAVGGWHGAFNHVIIVIITSGARRVGT